MIPKFRLGVTLYSYAGDFMVNMTLEDCLADVADAGATGIEILSETHIPKYPNPSDQWIEHWHDLLTKYQLKPTCYDCWVDSRMRKGRTLTVQESLDFLLMDMKLAHRLGFKMMRPKLGVVSEDLIPDPVWREMVERALPHAEKYDVKIIPEIHSPTPLKSKTVDDYLDLITKTGTKHFGLLIDAGIFKDRYVREPKKGEWIEPLLGIEPRELIPYLPYVHHIHAKFWTMNEELREPTIPYDKLVKVLIEQGWDGYLSAEYEGDRASFAGTEQIRRMFAMFEQITASAATA
jgi:sugar phosphate isomerase/epimerase